MAYFNAKNAPTIKPGTEMYSMELPPTNRAKSAAIAPEARDAIMSISNMDFVAANSPNVTGDGISRFLS